MPHGKETLQGGLPYEYTDSQLSGLFSQAGKVVSATIIIDKFSGRSRGFGFVEMENDDEAQKAIEMFNNYNLDGRNLVVNEAWPCEEGGRGGFGGGRGGDRGGYGGGRGGYGGYGGNRCGRY